MSDFQIEGECKECGATGLIGLSCPNPDCNGVITSMEAMDAPAEHNKPEQYEDEILEEIKQKDENVVSLESLAEEEAGDETDDNSTYEDL